MCVYERWGLFLFIAMLAIVYMPALAILVNQVVRLRRDKSPGTKTASLSLLQKVILTGAACGLPCLAYGYFVEPSWVEVTHVSITSDKLANYNRSMRIVQLSDLHCESGDKLADQLPALVASEKPDLIVFTGDAVNGKGGVASFRRCFTALSAIAPTYAVLGNHDTRCFSDLDLFKHTGVQTLNGANTKVSANGQDFYLAGVAFDCEALTDKALQAIPPGAFTIFLYHSPDLIMELAKRSVDLVLAGHTHGGQVCLPVYGAIITQSRFGKQFESGLHKVGNTWLYVNRGIGMEGGLCPRVRFLARPEITVYNLQPRSTISYRPKTASKQ